MWLGFDSRTWRHMWIEFVVGSCPCSEGFPLGSPVFLPPQKSTFLNSYLIWKQWMKSHFVEMSLQIPIIITNYYKQLLDEVFVISRIIKVLVSVISRSRRLRLITLTKTLIIPDITKTESNNCFIIHCFEENNDKRIMALPHKKISTLGLIPFCRVVPGYFSL